MAIGQLWETLKDAISAYTGLSPPAFFTVLAVAAAFYYAISECFSSPAPPPYQNTRDFKEVEPLRPPVQLGEITTEELRQYDGSDPKKPLLMAIKGQIYDVSQSRMFYGPGGPYALFAGKDASRALAKMSFEVKDLTGDTSGLGAFELDALQDWEYKFMSKYVKVGTVKKPEPVKEESNGNSSGVVNPVSEHHSDTKEIGTSENGSEEPAVEANFDKERNSEVGNSANGIAEHDEKVHATETEASND